jgi:hypothetical protein
MMVVSALWDLERRFERCEMHSSLGRTGSRFWREESYDRLCCDG